MTERPGIEIPRDLLPDDGRFGSGPSRVPQYAIDALAATGSAYLGTSHRKAPVKSVVASVRSGLAALYDLPAGYEVVLGVGGATAFWDAAAFGLVASHSAHFTCGEFSSKFASVCSGAPHLDGISTVAAATGSAPVPEAVEGADAYAYIHNETSTGVLGSWDRFGDEVVLVDGTSAAGAIPIDPSSIDAYYFSPQKAFGSEGGLWIALMSPHALARVTEIVETGRWIPPFLSLATAIDNSTKDQTYNTPALATLFLIDFQIHQLLDRGGLEQALAISTASSDHLYGWAAASPFASPFVSEERFRSPTVVTIDLDDSVPADVVSLHLRVNGIVDIDSYRKLGRNQLRIATFPTIPTDDIEALTACVDFIVEAM
jgi:phosphoserine aminotransferase